MAQLTPWWEAVALREEIRSASGSIDDVQMSLYNAVYGAAGAKAPYAKASYYGDITYPSHNLADLMAKVAVRLAGPGETYLRASALRRLDQGMGGGKSHGLIGLWHLATHASEFATTEIGRAALELAADIAGEPLPSDLAQPKVVVLACDNMTAGKGDKFNDGPAESLYERFLWRLFEGNNTLLKQYAPFHADKAKIAEALAYDGRPVLILIDEILDYVRQLSESKHADLRVQDMGFLKAVTDVVNDVPHVAMVVVMIDSEKDTMALDEIGEANRAEIEDSLKRNGTPATVTSNSDFVAILRRRLFDREAPREVVAAAAKQFVDHMTGPWQQKVFGALPKLASVDFVSEVERCYPFHPSLIQLVEQEWAPLAGFQKVRSTIRIFAATAWALAHRGKAGEWSPLLIGPGDVVLSNSIVREAIIGSGLISDPKTQANYRGIAAADIVGDDDRTGAARTLDTARAEDSSAPFVATNPRGAERMASALFLYSIVGTRAQGRRGATEAELKAASFVPDAAYGLADADTVLGELSDPDRGLAALERAAGTGGQAARLFLTTKQTLPMWFRSMRAGVSELDRDAELARSAERLGNTGPFRDRKWVEAPSEDEERAAGRPVHSGRQLLATAGLDDARSTRLVILDPRRFSLGNGVDSETRAAIRAAFGLGDEKLPVQWAASTTFAIANNQRRKVARAAVTDYVAWSRVCELDAVATDDDLKAKANAERNGARRAMEDLIKRAYQHVVYLGPDEHGTGRDSHEIRFEQDNQTALDGSIVWAALVDEGRAVGPGAFNAKALLVNLEESDYDRPLDEVRDRFWNSPRKPLLPGGEGDLRIAMHDAIREGKLRLIGGDGIERAVTRPEDVNLGSDTVRLTRPGPAEPSPEGPEVAPGVTSTGEPTEGNRHPGVDTEVAAPDVQVAFTITTSLTERTRRDAMWSLLDQLASQVDDAKVQHIQLTIKATVPKPEGESLADKAREAGASPSTTEL